MVRDHIGRLRDGAFVAFGRRDWEWRPGRPMITSGTPNLSATFNANTEADARAVALTWIATEARIETWTIVRVWQPRLDKPTFWRAEFLVTWRRPMADYRVIPADGRGVDLLGEPGSDPVLLGQTKIEVADWLEANAPDAIVAIEPGLVTEERYEATAREAVAALRE